MNLEIQPLNHQALELTFSGILCSEDYRYFIPEAEKFIGRYGQVAFLINLNHFHGWKLPALWENLRFGIRHFSKINRIALVGDDQKARWIARLARIFTGAETRFFKSLDRERARAWVKGEIRDPA